MLGGVGKGSFRSVRDYVIEVKKKWIHMKSETKGSVAAARKSMRQTGGGEMVEMLTSSQQKNRRCHWGGVRGGDGLRY